MRSLVLSLALLLSGYTQAQSLEDSLKRAAGLDQARPDEQAKAPDDESKGQAGSDLSSDSAASGIKEALARGTQAAVTQLGREDGFLKDEAVKIALPKSLSKLGKAASSVGAGDLVDDLVLSMNRAAESAVPAAAEIFADSIRDMSMEDAIGIVRGGDTAGTDYFRRSAGAALEQRFLPIVAEQTARTGVSGYYKSLSKKAGGLMGLAGEQPDLDQYVTDKAIDGLFYYVAEQEKQIRKDPLGTGSDLLRKVFGR
jgi:hypothetical protein